MLRKTLKLFIEVLLFSVIGVWLANNHGLVSAEWVGYRMDMSMPVALALAWALFFAIDRLSALLSRVLRLFRRRPKGDGSEFGTEG